MPGLRSNLMGWCLALSLTVLAQAQLVVYGHCCEVGKVTWAGHLLTLAETLPVAWRRRAPVPLTLLAGAAAIAQIQLDSPITDFSKVGVMVLFFTVASQSRQAVAIAMAALTPIGILATVKLDRFSTPNDLMVVYVQFAVAWGLGAAARHRRRLVAERAARIEREKEERAQAAAAAERSRIAHELHDVVTHSLSVISIQASAAQSVVDAAPDQLTACLRTIETVSREAWAEMRLFLDRQTEIGGADEPPRGGLAHLAELVERFEQTGLSVDLEITGDVRPLPADVDLCAYRIVQESLTNVLRHAGDDRARVAIGYGERNVLLEIANAAGRIAATTLADGGHHGIGGMRERARQAGGELSVENAAGRFTVRAQLPVGAPG
jgi:signal transduction histidine kinase